MCTLHGGCLIFFNIYVQSARLKTLHLVVPAKRRHKRGVPGPGAPYPALLTGKIFDHICQVPACIAPRSIYALPQSLIPVQDHIKVIRKADLCSYILIFQTTVPCGSVIHGCLPAPEHRADRGRSSFCRPGPCPLSVSSFC